MNPSQGTIQSPAGTAPAGAFEPTGPAMHRSLDRWLACDPGHIEPDKLEDLQQSVRAQPGEGVRVRFVIPDMTLRSGKISLLDYITPVFGALRQRVEFFHAELMDGPEAGLFIACDNRAPALICQHWVLDDTAEPTWDLPEGHPVHVNLLIHGEAKAISAALQQPGIQSVFRWLEKQQHYVHQVTLALSDLHDRGFSVGVETVLDEQGSQGGPPAAAY